MKKQTFLLVTLIFVASMTYSQVGTTAHNIHNGIVSVLIDELPGAYKDSDVSDQQILGTIIGVEYCSFYTVKSVVQRELLDAYSDIHVINSWTKTEKVPGNPYYSMNFVIDDVSTLYSIAFYPEMDMILVIYSTE